jgi:hypothetical protein
MGEYKFEYRLGVSGRSQQVGFAIQFLLMLLIMESSGPTRNRVTFVSCESVRRDIWTADPAVESLIFCFAGVRGG